MGEKNIDFEKLIEVFNRDGKVAAESFVENTYGRSYAVVQRQIKKETNYFFNRNTRKYELKEKPESNFMTIEELYEGDSQTTIPKDDINYKAGIVDPISDSFKELMLTLMKDKMQELNKYIYLEQSTKQVVINLRELEENGYEVMIN